MQLLAISIDSASSELTVPSVCEVVRKSMMASARRFLVTSVACYVALVLVVVNSMEGRGISHHVWQTEKVTVRVVDSWVNRL
jgi:hypothetical protein